MQPETEFGFFLSFNALEGGTARTAVTNAVIDWFYPGAPELLPAFPTQPLAGSAERIAAIAGAYRLNRRSYTQLEGVTGLAGDLSIVPAEPGEISIPVPNLGGRFIEVAPYVFRQQGRQELLVFEADDAGQVRRAYIGSLPIMVADKVPPLEQASTHQLVIGLALLASLFVLINAVRNRGQTEVRGAALLGRYSLVAASTLNLLFVIGLVLVFTGVKFNDLLFDFPPPGVGVVLVAPLLSVLFTVLAAALLVPVWRTPQCSFWQRLRYSYVVVVFILFVLVMWYWNLLGWNY